MTQANLLNKLNDKQREVVASPLLHLAVIAGAGSGKTRVLVHRIAWLIQHEQVNSNHILAVTFTNKAAAQMRDRVEQLTHLSVRNMWLGTFHGIAHRLLRMHWKQAGLPETFQILDSDDQFRLIKKVHHALNLDDDKWPPNQSQWYINNRKDEGLRPGQVEIIDHVDKVLNKVYETYEKECLRSGLVDFAELLLRSYEMLAESQELLEHYQQRFGQILVDEFQDTNTIQYNWLKLLAGTKAKVMVVGDDDQSIYSWRGAQVQNIAHFSQDFPSQLIRLEQNYRSTQVILSAANAVIANNNNRLGKNLWTQGAQGERISVYMAFNEVDEARYIVSQIKLGRDEGVSLKNIAVLYRSNAQSRVLEEELLGANLPYRIYGGQKFFERAEIKDALAYLRLLINPYDDTAFERSVNMPPRGIGHTTLANLRDYARSRNLSLWEASEETVEQGQLSARSTHSIASFLALIRKFQQENFFSLDAQTKTIIHESGLYEHYSKDRSDKTQSRLENLQELIQATAQFKQDPSLALPPLQAFLSYVALESGENQADPYEDSVQLMTLHSAKGLEFQIVFLAGMEEGLFPHKMSVQEADRLEEERRLCYVGMTRAEQKLYLCYAESRRINGTQNYRHRSRFINEIPPDLLQEVRVRTQITRPVQIGRTPLSRHDTGLAFQLGDRVKHHRFGEGIVINYEGQGPQAQIIVRFAKEGTKRLVLELAKLEKV